MDSQSSLSGFHLADKLEGLIDQCGKAAHGQSSLEARLFKVFKQGLIFGVINGLYHCPDYEDKA